MLIYFTNNHMLGLNYVSAFTFEEKKQKEDRFEKMLMKSCATSKKQNWYHRINRIFFYAKYEQI